MKTRIREWFEWHQISSHILAPIWVRIPTKWRWEIVHHLDRSQRLCWADLVSAAMAEGRESDACDVSTPLGCATASRCKAECSIKACPGDSDEHRCYCGKFAVQHAATDHATQKLAEMRDLRGISTTEHEEHQP